MPNTSAPPLEDIVTAALVKLTIVAVPVAGVAYLVSQAVEAVAAVASVLAV